MNECLLWFAASKALQSMTIQRKNYPMNYENVFMENLSKTYNVKQNDANWKASLAFAQR